MAFIRAYTAQGDPRRHFSFMRAGQLFRRGAVVRGARLQRVKGLSRIRGRRGTAARRRALLAAGGDPFSLRMPKFLRKLSLQKVIKGVGKLANIVSPIVPGASALASVASELTTQPAPTGPPSMAARSSSGYMVEGTEVTPETSGQVYNVFARRRQVAEEQDEDTGEDEDVADVGDEDESTDEESD